MSTTKHFYKEYDNNLKFYSELSLFELNGIAVEKIPPHRLDEKKFEAMPEKFPDDHKIVLRLNLSFFHLFWDTVSTFLMLKDQFPNHKYIFICENATIEEFTIHKHVTFFLNLLKKTGVDYYIHSQNEYGFFKAKDCYTIAPGLSLHWSHPNAISNIKKELGIMYNIKEIEPFRKTYLSRKKYSLSTEKEDRIENETSIENFFKKQGFEIIYPEDFATMEDQINYFNEVKILCGVTGSGLTNSVFMNNETILIELVVTLESQNKPIFGDETLLTEVSQHHFYQAIAFLKNQMHIAIPKDYFKNNIYNKKIINLKNKKYNLDILLFGN